jgi:cystathionine gamma-lyase
MPAFMENSMKVATFLENHPKVKSVNHPGLSSHPQHKLALKQSSGHSSLLSFTIIDTGSSMKFLGSLQIFCNAASFGGCESLAELP